MYCILQLGLGHVLMLKSARACCKKKSSSSQVCPWPPLGALFCWSQSRRLILAQRSVCQAHCENTMAHAVCCSCQLFTGVASSCLAKDLFLCYLWDLKKWSCPSLNFVLSLQFLNLKMFLHWGCNHHSTHSHQQGTCKSTKTGVCLEMVPATNSMLWVWQWKFFPLKTSESCSAETTETVVAWVHAPC